MQNDDYIETEANRKSSRTNGCVCFYLRVWMVLEANGKETDSSFSLQLPGIFVRCQTIFGAVVCVFVLKIQHAHTHNIYVTIATIEITIID